MERAIHLRLLLAAWLAVGAHGCTSVMMSVDNGPLVIGRTMELGIPYSKSELEQIYLHARGTPVGTAHGTHYNASKYGYLAIQFAIASISPGTFASTEGINEAGLTVSAQIHEGASYQPGSNKTSGTTVIYDVQATAFLLACCKTIDEAHAALAAVRVIPTPLLGHLGSLHWSVQEASGKSAAFEYIDQGLRVYDNTEVGVLTNDPGYEWHLGHLNFYAAYPMGLTTPAFQPTVTSSGPFSSASVPVSGDGSGITTTTAPVYHGHGLNTRGLPGGYTPPDRFVKMFLLKQAAYALAPPRSLDEGIIAVTGLLNTVHIVRGTVTIARGSGILGMTPEYTNWACVKVPWASSPNATAATPQDQQQQQQQPPPQQQPQPGGGGAAAASGGPLFYYRTYDNMQWKRIELGRIDFSKGRKFAPIQLYEPGLGIKDATPVS